MAVRSWLEAAGFVVLPACALLLAVKPPVLVSPHAPRGEVAVVVDGRAKAVRIRQPFAGATIYAGIAMPDYLLVTAAPATILDTFAFGTSPGKPTLLDKIFPAVGRIPRVIYARADSLETMLLQQPGAVLTWNFVAPRLEAVGLPTVGLPIADETDLLRRVRIYAEVAGEPGRSGAVISSYEARTASLQEELRPDNIAPKLRVLMLNRNGGQLSVTNSHASVWHRAGLVEAQPELSGGSVDAEAVLAIDPDILLVTGTLTPNELRTSPALRDLRAVRVGRVYALPPGVATHPWNIVDLPFYARWLAELAYPERLSPELRKQMRATYLEELGYRCSEDDLDRALCVGENRSSRGYQRFVRIGPGP